MILACDVGTISGFAVGAPGATPKLSSYDFRGELKDPSEIFYEFGCVLEGMMRMYDLQYYAFEWPWVARGPLFNMKTVYLLLGLHAEGERRAHQHKLKILKSSTGTVAKFVLGNGGLKRDIKKAETLRVLRETHGWKPRNEDQADAGAVWLYWEHNLAPTYSMARGIGTLFPAKAQQRKAVVIA